MQQSREPLDSIQAASPCGVSWDGMEGDDRVRLCAACRLNVYNLPAMDAEEAAALMSESTDWACRLYRRSDGTVLIQDCPEGLRAARCRRVKGAAGSALLSAGVGLLVLGRCLPEDPARNDPAALIASAVTAAGMLVFLAGLSAVWGSLAERPRLPRRRWLSYLPGLTICALTLAGALLAPGALVIAVLALVLLFPFSLIASIGVR